MNRVELKVFGQLAMLPDHPFDDETIVLASMIRALHDTLSWILVCQVSELRAAGDPDAGTLRELFAVPTT